MKGYLLDTNICIYLLKQRYDIEKRIKQTGYDNCFISDITLAELNGKGLLIDDFDLLIGATALTYHLTLVTENVKHLARIPGIRIENWIQR